MSSSTARSLAMMAAEDGDLQEADETLSRMIDELGRALQARPAPDGSAVELCRCLLDRAAVRGWAVRPVDALHDLDRAEQLADGLLPLNRRLLRVNLLDTRARLLSTPSSPSFDPEAAWEALSRLRQEANTEVDRWVPDATELQLASRERDWARVAVLAPPVIDRLTALGHPRGAQATRIQLARALLELGRPVEAVEPAAAAHAFFGDAGPEDIAANAALVLARARGRAEDWDLAEQALARVEHLTRTQRSLFDQQRFLVEKLQLYDDALALALGHASSASSPAARRLAILRAWQVAERAKSFSLRQAMTQGGWLKAIDPDCATELAALEQRLDAVEAQAGRSEASVRMSAELSARRQQVLQAAMQRRPVLALVHAAPRLDLGSVLNSIPAGTGVMSWYWLERPQGWQLHVFHAGADRQPRHVQSDWTRDEVDGLRTRQVGARSAAVALHQMLPATLGDRVFPAEVLDALAGCHSLLLTPHRHLRQLPLHAAEVSQPGVGERRTSLLIERFAVQVLPTLALPFPASPPRPPPRRVLLMGCRKDGFGNALLEDVPVELAALSETWSKAGHSVELHPLQPEDQLAQHVDLMRWPDFDVIHLACHGQFVPESPLDATLYLGSKALRASEFFGVQLQAEVVCMSACDVGQQGDTLDGLTLVSDEWLGLALPLFQAGTRALLTSLWRADSASARAFMQVFHQALAQGLDPARAHQQACRSQIRRPYRLWANWQLAGFPASVRDDDRRINTTEDKR